MGLPARLTGGAACRQAPPGGEAGWLLWPAVVLWRLGLILVGSLWRAPERLLPGLHRAREIRRCRHEIDRAIARLQRQEAPLPPTDVPFEGPAVPVPTRPRGDGLVLSFPTRPRRRR